MNGQALPEAAAGINVPSGADYDELIGRVADSPLYNEDLRPIRREERSWHGRNILALWVSISIVLTTYTLASGLIEEGMTWQEAIFTIGLGNVIVLIPMVLNAYAGVKYGIPFPVFVRSSFGTSGAKVAAMARGLVACGWFGIQTWLGALALSQILGRLLPAWSSLHGHNFIAFGVFWGFEMLIMAGGIEAIRALQRWAAPLLTLVLLALFGWAVHAGGGLSAPLAASEQLAHGGHSFAELFWPSLAANIGYWATLSLNIPDFTRYATSQKAQLFGQGVGLPIGMMATSFVGIFVTATAFMVFHKVIWNPIDLVPYITSSNAVLIIAMLAVMVAQLSINMAANVVSPANDISNLAPHLISFRGGVVITGLIGILMQPWYLIGNAAAYVFTWLSGYGSLLGAVGAVMIIDYWLLRGRRLELEALYVEDGLYPKWKINAFIAVLVAVGPMLPGFLIAATTPGGIPAHPSLLIAIYSFGWIWSFPVAGGLYYVLERMAARRLAVA
ncbi:NCS1 family nucleobase:cation symporter-1 [Acidocella aminolytica]|jgi:NCS1 family nucleobase:cation symporter-1|uniref:Nucleoside transporter NCS1 n=1 Tax=Acidocella aminolytica 101 = DSM 11237 TaxID=1120923 RepID=A0A0D6PJJ9_9PROT|nr:NCS1 family nucleobase:cation symporter-1 [Acidocella aminolytica]GAN81842.1 nucleoside transporter NCS1 [Acidocella aminolytica 101 = DSM 11237]GBQ42844.1 cytosine/uracil/thiamine/allantoin permease [Acidocella aminolytica 101 = DSM 11237]SHE30740.1 nucleobase:cation symporter-1, NCS1 family [Acidocella aminolytica 101 = DSM 11237]